MNHSLRFRPDGTFTIVQFTDTHFENGDAKDVQTSTLMSQVLDWEQPDLVLFTGDVLGGEKTRDPKAAWCMATVPLVARGLPWAAVFGNHDDESGASRRQLLAMQQQIPGCLTRPGPSQVSGVANFLLHIRGSRKRHAAATLCCLDSNSYAETAIGGYGWVREDQIRWCRRNVQRLPSNSTGHLAPVLVFLHIPLPEFNELWLQGHCLGEKNEAVCCPRINTGLFATLHLAGNVRGVFAGHDHLNDYDGRLHGMSLCYGRATGYNTYGREDFLHGARVIRLHEGEPDFTTWLRLEDGSRIDRPVPPRP